MTKYQVTITSVSGQVVPLVKSLRLVADLGLKDAKRLSDYLATAQPCVLVAGINQEVANHVIELLRDAGVEAIAEESILRHPMLLCPAADQTRVWSWVRGPFRG